ncbi:MULTISPECIES: bifunctional diguanylate cyclase/phosphodiesterase [unclassified Wenzhouxiangella]|uniref:putative bifunctional diguanylate cyclase/phosphodiesterase n=1 Tax=unclassified Wenzhouxiangella TaxID=2613841 RepID=UPI0015F247E7|nr:MULTISPECIES: EAL domain-containing protein [unclassified Wenzhouxiangella]
MVGLLWILGSDAFLLFTGALAQSAFVEEVTKGSLFVGLSALAVYLLVQYLPIRRHWLPVLVALAYLVLGLAWIVGSDLYLFNMDQLTREGMWAQMLKGSAFVAVSAFLIFVVTKLIEDQPVTASTARSEIQVHPFRVAALFGVVLLCLSLILDFYEVVVSQEILPAEFGKHLVESLLLTLFASITLFLLLRFYISRAETAHQRIAASEARFRALFENSPDMVFLTRPDGAIEAANPAAETALELSEAEIIERGRDGVVDSSDPALEASLSERERTGRARATIRFRRADGTSIPVDMTSARFQSPGGEAQAFVVARDISDRLESERQLELVAAAFRGADEAMMICDADFVILDVNQAYTRLIGCERDDAIGSRPPFLEVEQQEDHIRQGIQAKGHWRGELLQQSMAGRVFVSRAAVSEVQDPHGGDPYLVVNFEDISQLRDYERKVDYLSYHDPLTGLPNREALRDWFQSGKVSDESGTSSNRALALMNLDRLKTVNNAFGHVVGDQLIEELARRLRKVCEGDDYVARLIGDDFVMVVGDVSDTDQAVEIIHERMARLTAPIRIEQLPIHPTVCAGITLSPEHGTNLDELLRKADVAMREAKHRGRGEIVVFTPEMTEQLEYQLLIERQLRSGLDNREFLLHFQPSVWLSNSRVIGLEALVRWNNPELGLVPPNNFIGVAEDNGMIIELGAWVFEETCRQIAEWRTDGVPFGWVAVNFSSIQFQDPGLLEAIRTSMQRHRVEGREIRVEITESVLVMDPDWTVQLLQSLRDMGIMIAVDDFGTGYSSLAYLKQFPVDFVKLDKSFISGLPRDESDASIVSSVIDLAQRLGMGVVAEGIERTDQLEFLKNAGCPEAQGYYFSPPMDLEDIPWLLKNHPELPVRRPDNQ